MLTAIYIYIYIYIYIGSPPPYASFAEDGDNNNSNNSVALVREQIILAERLPHVGKVGANFCK
jgi:hypothetical protein